MIKSPDFRSASWATNFSAAHDRRRASAGSTNVTLHDTLSTFIKLHKSYTQVRYPCTVLSTTAQFTLLETYAETCPTVPCSRRVARSDSLQRPSAASAANASSVPGNGAPKMRKATPRETKLGGYHKINENNVSNSLSTMFSIGNILTKYYKYITKQQLTKKMNVLNKNHGVRFCLVLSSMNWPGYFWCKNGK